MKDSPVLSSFGPRLGLARELLKLGERETVIAYLNACTTFWRTGQDKLRQWITQLKNGETPDLR